MCCNVGKSHTYAGAGSAAGVKADLLLPPHGMKEMLFAGTSIWEVPKGEALAAKIMPSLRAMMGWT